MILTVILDKLNLLKAIVKYVGVSKGHRESVDLLALRYSSHTEKCRRSCGCKKSLIIIRFRIEDLLAIGRVRY